MMKINRNLIAYSLGILAILALGILILPGKAGAREYATYRFGSVNNNNYAVYQFDSGNRANENSYIEPTYNTQPVAYPNPVNTNYDNSQSSNYASPNYNNQNANGSDGSNNNSDLDAYKNVAAGVIFGTDSFMPSGLMQWIILAIFILLITILVRRVFSKDERYYSEPLKHA